MNLEVIDELVRFKLECGFSERCCIQFAGGFSKIEKMFGLYFHPLGVKVNPYRNNFVDYGY
ncbi:MAG: hypothetical protein Kow0042_06580 [Calditrichia bacterium]